MSVLATIFSILGFFTSPFGMLAIILGLLTFIALPILASATGWEAPGQFYLGLARLPLRRVAVVVDEHNGATFKPMEYDPNGVEIITLDDQDKEFEDPDGALTTWKGVAFALADEDSGVLFDPRHAALGQRKHELVQRDEGEYIATNDEWDERGVTKWKPAVFEMPTRHEIVDLSRVRELIDGGERSEYPKRVKELYKHSRAPFHDGNPISKFFYPIIAFVITFGGIWFMASQFGTVGSGLPGTGGSTVGYGAGTLAFLLTTTNLGGSRDWRRLARSALAILAPIGLLGVIGVVAGPVAALAVLLAYTVGFCMVPGLTLFLSHLPFIGSVLATTFSQLYFRLGFLSYQNPVFEWQPDGYHVRDYPNLETTEEQPTWYSLFGTQIGFTYTPGRDAWGPEYIDHDELEAHQEPLADGGATTDTNLPAKYVRTDLSRGDTYGGFIPKRLKRSHYYLLTGIAAARFKFSAAGEKSLRRLLEAKETEGEPDGGMNDGLVFKTTAASGLFGVILGVIFFLL